MIEIPQDRLLVQRIEDLVVQVAALRQQGARIEGKLDALFALRSSQEEGAARKAMELAQTLTAKQHAVMQMVGLGWNEREIARVMGISRNTVKLHKQAGLHKLGLEGARDPQVGVARWFADIAGLLGEEGYTRISGGISRTWAAAWREGDALPEVLRKVK